MKNKIGLLKVIIAILGGIDVVFRILTPAFIVLLIITVYGYGGMWTNFLIIAGILAGVFRAIKIGVLSYNG